MKTMMLSLCALFLSLFAVSNSAQAQTAEEHYYYYTDVNTGVTYTLYMKFMGYQTEVWTTSTNIGNKWYKGTVTYSSSQAISFTDGYSSKKYHIEMDPRNLSAVKLFSEDRKNSWRYWEKS